jgi:drug/metabolite transporter (DMT)-like permease
VINISANHLVRTGIFTLMALIAFAANSVLCRMALGSVSIDASSFTLVRLVSGALILSLILRITNNKIRTHSKGSWFSGLMLFTYAITFAFAYTTLDTATGALILFGAVQITIILLSVISGDRLNMSEWIGVTIALSGFFYLVIPGVTTPSAVGFALMTIAGIAWGIYTLNGRSSQSPIMDTTYNFLRSVPLIIIVTGFTIKNIHYSSEGLILAGLSGGIASGIGYAIWYNALRGLSAAQAAVVQLLVPVIAAFGGVIFISEVITLRLILAAVMILGGILLVVLGRSYQVQFNLNRKI